MQHHQITIRKTWEKLTCFYVTSHVGVVYVDHLLELAISDFLHLCSGELMML